MNQIDVQPRHLTQISDILKKYLPPNAKIFFFGSRTKNCAKTYSDLDIAIDLSGEKLDLSILTKLKSSFERTTIPYSIDIVDLNSISKDFMNNIKADLVEL